MASVLIKAETGRDKGSRPSRRLRRAGRVPAVLYGMSEEPVKVSVTMHDLRHALSGEAGRNVLVLLRIGDVEHPCVVKELQRHPVRREVLHVDFARVDPGEKIEFLVPLVLTGEAKKVTQASGMVDQVIHHLPVRAHIDDIPTRVTADVSDLEVGSSLRVASIDLPEGVVPAGDPEAPFAVGLITRSTKEYLRQLKSQEEAGDVLSGGLAGEDEPAELDSQP